MDRLLSQRFLRGSLVFLVVVATIAMILSLKSILAPLVAGFVIAYILDPFADFLESKGMKRFPAVILIFVISGTLFSAAVIGGSVMVAKAGISLAQKTLGEPRTEALTRSQAEKRLGYTDLKSEPMSGLPTIWYFDRNGNGQLDRGWLVEAELLIQEKFPGVGLGFQRWKNRITEEYGRSADENPDEALARQVESTLDLTAGRFLRAVMGTDSSAGEIKGGGEGAAANGSGEMSVGAKVASRVASGGQSALDSLLELGNWLLLVPIYVFFFLLEIDPMLARMRRWIPSGSRPRLEKIALEIHGILSGFFRGRLLVCLVKGGITGVGLFLIGVPYGFLIGFAAGFLSLVPYVGVWLALLPAVGICWFEHHDVVLLVLTAALFGVMEAVEGFVLIPRFLGDEAGLHPVTVIVTFLIFAQWFGLLGMLLSVPMAAVSKTLLREFVVPLLKGPDTATGSA